MGVAVGPVHSSTTPFAKPHGVPPGPSAPYETASQTLAFLSGNRESTKGRKHERQGKTVRDQPAEPNACFMS
jgi:hypothetical protein